MLKLSFFSNLIKSGLQKIPPQTLSFCLAILLIKIALLVIFSDPMFFMGDSMSYLSTAETGWIPTDRSFIYGFVIAAIFKIRHSLNTILVFQTLLSTLSCLCLAHILIRYIKCNKNTAILLTLFFAIEPNQLVYERFIMTETLAGFAFSCFLVCSFAFLESRKIFWGIVLALLSVLVISFRISYLPAVILGSLFLFVRVFGFRWPMVLRTLLCGLTLFFGIEGYKLLNGRLSDKTPALLYADGFFLIAGQSPLLTPDILKAEGVSPEIIKSWSPRPLRWASRSAEMWDPKNGIVALLKRYSSSTEEANRVAKRLAIRCVLKKPIDFFKLMLFSYGTYFDRKIYWRSLQNEFAGPYRGPGDEPLLKKLVTTYRYTPTQHRSNSGLVQYYTYFRLWFLFLLVFPIIGTALLFFRKFHSGITLFLMTSYNLSVLVFITNGDANFRYLHPFPILLLPWLGWVTRSKDFGSND